MEAKFSNVNPTSEIFATENFGPIVAITTFKTDAQALDLANAGNAGLMAYFCTRDLTKAFDVSKEMTTGMVGVNEGILSTAYAPFGGVGESGIGREGGDEGIREYLHKKYVMLNY